MHSASVITPPIPEANAEVRGGLSTKRPALYASIILIIVFAAFAFYVRQKTLFACQATLYSSDRYVAYCNGAQYGDYEHGAFWFNLEPSANNSARDADVLFLGNSHSQFAFSTAATSDWFSEAAARYYLLGFTYFEGMPFSEELLRRIQPKARVYVINVEDIFNQWESPPAKAVMHDPQARARYETKQLWQRAHELLCEKLPILCGHQYAYFRSRQTGGYELYAGKNLPPPVPVSYDQAIDQDVVNRYAASGRDFLARLPVKQECVILTAIPTVGTKMATAKALAAALGQDLVAPEIEGLLTFDGSHLDKQSAERWSQAFFQAAGPKIRSCLEQLGATPG